MAGYGARQGVSTDTRDPLHARAVVLDDGERRVGIVCSDLIGVSPRLIAHIRERTGEMDLLVAATHTHQGPAFARGRLDEHGERCGDLIADAVVAAAGRLEPVTLRAGTAAIDSVSQNRRDPDGAIETNVRVLSLDGQDGPVATIVNYACHPTVLEYDNLRYSADWVGAAMGTVEAAVGGIGLYLQGCCGDINPVWTAHTFDEADRIGRIVGSAAARVGCELRAHGRNQRAVNLSWSEQTPKPPSGALLDEAPLRSAFATVEVAHRDIRSVDDLDAEIADLREQLDEANSRELRPRLNAVAMERVLIDRGVVHPGRTETLELQAVRLAQDCVVVTLPGEFLVATARTLEQRCGVEHLLIAGYANGYCGYVPPAEEFPEGGYEVGMARFETGAEAKIVDSAVDLVRTVARAN